MRCTISFMLLALLLATARSPGGDVIPAKEVDELVKPAVAGQWLQSVSIGLLDERGAQMLAYGTLSPASDKAADGQTVYEIGSISKTFTGTLLAQMVTKKDLSLDQPVQELLPASVKVPRTSASPITLLHLATHRSGLPRMPANFSPADPGNPYADYSVQQMYDFISGYQLPRDPGAAALYSNLGVGLLGHAISRHAGMSYEQLLVTRICNPLKMADTRITLNDSLRSRLAPGFDADGGPQKNWDLPTFAGAGAIRSTATDMLKYLSANAGISSTDFRPALDLAQTRQSQYDPQNGIGLNWLIEEKTGIRWHNGQTGGYHSYVAFHPDRRVAVVVLSNTGSGMVDAIGSRLIHRLLGTPLGSLKLRPTIVLPSEKLDRYVGEYKMGLLSTLTIRKAGDHLTAQLTGQGAAGIYAESETEFHWKVVDAHLTFDVDEAGNVTGLTLHQNGANLPAKRIGS